MTSAATHLLTALQATAQRHPATLRKGQSLLDAALQHCGNADSAWQIARLNSLPLDHVAATDEDILIPEPDVRSVRVLAEHACQPCTGELDHTVTDTYFGIGHRQTGTLRVASHHVPPAIVRQRIQQYLDSPRLASAENAVLGLLQ